ncbi:MAG: hypothetical protein IJ237_09065 [Oscillospiraceae bacterium]|nr:hypothetical protein [Oscillospiraceae bacterium]
MKILENVKALNEMDLTKIAGGYDDNHTIFDTFVEWLIQLPTHYPEETPDADRPLPFPQDRRGNKAPMAPQAPARPLPFPQDRR